MRILITGAAGFIGSNLANYLNDDYNIDALDNLQFGRRDNLYRNVTFTKASIGDLTEVYLNRYDVLIHLACANIIYAQDHPIETFKTNALDTIDMFSKFEGKIIYTSTSSVYGQADELPTPETAKLKVSNAYDQSKLIAEKYLQQRGDYTTLRLSNVYGPNQRADNPYSGVIGKFIDSAVNGKPFTVYGGGKATRDYTYISDVLRIIEACISANALNTEVNVSGGCELSVLELIDLICELTDADKSIHYDNSRKIDKIDRRVLDCSKAKELGWEAEVSIEQGILDTINWFNLD